MNSLGCYPEAVSAGSWWLVFKFQLDSYLHKLSDLMPFCLGLPRARRLLEHSIALLAQWSFLVSLFLVVLSKWLKMTAQCFTLWSLSVSSGSWWAAGSAQPAGDQPVSILAAKLKCFSNEMRLECDAAESWRLCWVSLAASCNLSLQFKVFEQCLPEGRTRE